VCLLSKCALSIQLVYFMVLNHGGCYISDKHTFYLENGMIFFSKCCGANHLLLVAGIHYFSAFHCLFIEYVSFGTADTYHDAMYVHRYEKHGPY